MIKKNITLFLLASITTACHVTADFKPATLSEQCYNAGAIMAGTVANRFYDINSGTYSIILDNSVFYRGCGPKANQIDGFVGSQNCGVNVPRVGEEVVVFVCRHGWFSWKINAYKAFCGCMKAKNDTLNEIKTMMEREKKLWNCEPDENGVQWIHYGQCHYT